MLYFGALAFLIAFFTAPLATAQGITPEHANQYYQTCMAVDDQRMTADAQEALCSCTAARLPMVMTENDILTMNPEPGHAGRPAYDKMIAYVYGPCMQYPIQDKLMHECLNDSKIENFALRDPGAVCLCMATRTGDMLGNSETGTQIITELLRRNPGMQDPYDFILNDGRFRQYAYDMLLNTCLTAGN
jgi:hypothetical protein